MKNPIPYFWNKFFEQVNHPSQSPFVLQNYTGNGFSNILRNSYKIPNENYETRIMMAPYSYEYNLQPCVSQVEFVNESLSNMRSAFTPIHKSSLFGSVPPSLVDSLENYKSLRPLGQI